MCLGIAALCRIFFVNTAQSYKITLTIADGKSRKHTFQAIINDLGSLFPTFLERITRHLPCLLLHKPLQTHHHLSANLIFGTEAAGRNGLRAMAVGLNRQIYWTKQKGPFDGFVVTLQPESSAAEVPEADG